MDPYYQPQSQLVSGGSRELASGVPSAPVMQVNAGQPQQMMHHQNLSGSHRSAAGYSQQTQQSQLVGQQQQQQQPQHQQQPLSMHQSQQVKQPQSYQDSYNSNPQMSQMRGQQQHQPNGLSHHGGQAPLPPSVGGHHSGRGYGSHRAALHQHRSSAAAISDPMMASGMTEQLASASGPLTGSGSALNQLGASAYPTGGQYYPTDYPTGGGHQSRYEAHQARRERQLAMQAGTTTAGAYHLDRADLMQADPMLGLDGRYYPPGVSSLHGSLANLPAGKPRQRYSQDYYPQQQADRYYGLEAGVGPMRASSMPPHSLVDPYLDQSEMQFAREQQHQVVAAGYNPSSNRETELRARLLEAQNSYASVKRELETATQKLGSSMHSIKSFWSPELKKERALRKEETTKYALINDQMKLMRVEVQVSTWKRQVCKCVV